MKKLCVIILGILGIYIYVKNSEKINFKPNHFTILKDNYTNYDRTNYVSDFYENKIKIDVDYMNYEKLSLNKVYNSKKLKEDLDMFIYLLQTRYGNYYKFGGDKEFLKRKVEFEKYIGTKSELTLIEFNDKLSEYFSNIKDVHFVLNTINIYPKQGVFYIYPAYLSKKEISEFSNEDDKKYIKYTLDNKGKIRYTLVFNRSILNIKLKNGENKEYNLNLLRSLNSKSKEEYKEFQKFHYLKINDFKKDFNYYDKYINKIKNKDLVLDLRSSSGGYEHIVEGIIQNYYKGIINLFDLRIKSYIKYDFTVANENNWRYTKYINKKNKHKIYILIDKKAGSAPEYLSIDLKLMDSENVMIIGTNSMGAIVSGTRLYSYILPNTKLRVRFGSYETYDVNKAQEGLGVEPDIWLDPNDEKFVEKVKNFVENN